MNKKFVFVKLFKPNITTKEKGMKKQARQRDVAKKYGLYNFRSSKTYLIAEKGVGFTTILGAIDYIIGEQSEYNKEMEPIIKEVERQIFNSLTDIETKEKYPAKKVKKQKQEPNDLEMPIRFLQQYIARKLSIPFIKLQEVQLEGSTAGFFNLATSKMGVDYTRFLCACMTYSIICHETKHAYQTYLSEKFLTHKQLPKSNLDKLLLLYNSFNSYIKGVTSISELYEKYGFDKLIKNYKKTYFKVNYFELPNELDAYSFEIECLNKLQKKYIHFKTPYSYQFLVLRKYTLLNGLNYHKEGLNHKGIHNCKQVIKSMIYASSKHGAFGKEHKEFVDSVLASGFDIDNAFLSITKKLDKFYDELICLAHNMRAHGIKADFEKNGYIDFNKILDENTEIINPNIVKFIPIWVQEENPNIDYSISGCLPEEKSYFEEVLERATQEDDEDELLCEKFGVNLPID